MTRMKPMERLGTLPEMQARLAELQRKAAVENAEAAASHTAAMAQLPLGTCPECYGTKIRRRNGYEDRCPQCDPPIQHAEGVPYEFYDSRLTNYREEDGNKAALAKAKAWLAGTRDLYLTGGVGAGKTRLACALANTAFEARKWPLFVRVPLMLHQLQPGRDQDEVAEFEGKLMARPMLVLDDIGAERDQATDYTRRTLLLIYEERGDRGNRTIFTSNKTLQQLAEMQDDDRLASRIAGRADVVHLTTSDQRLARRGK